MKKLVLFLFFIAFLGFSTAAYERPDHYECYENKLCIYPGMDDNNISNDPVNDSGRTWNATMEIHNASYQINISERIENVSFEKLSDTETLLTFDGVLEVKSECHVPDFSVNYPETQVYTMNISGDKADDWTCTRRPTRIDYTMKFETNPMFRINVSHNNLSRTLETKDFMKPMSLEDVQGEPEEENEENTQETETTDQQGGLFSGLINFFSGLF